ncbi:glutathione S-transferase family protein [Altericroceibacterium endophyticum]|uniref:Glutathione S-transferase n=1 Tax=Altericroceibacterium endophyticum TaxID=1808508 RepID=A0A6I4T202_9SPHN|nr:glutathione S-transferase [Altericroceibacterium endophyticum]MXO64261.1 glutathione S-transferase [Altericroceibacterium endophyticum]
MLTVYHLRMSQSERIVWLCEELGLDYELKLYDRRADNRLAPDSYKQLHPMGIAPVIEDNGQMLGESGAIVEYIDAIHGGGKLSLDSDHPDFADHLFWLHFSNGTMMATAIAGLVLQGGEGENPRADFIADRMKKCSHLIEHRLGEAEFFGGSQLTTADIMMVFCLTTGRHFSGQSLDNMPDTRAYLQRIGARAAYRKAMEKAEPGLEPNLT